MAATGLEGVVLLIGRVLFGGVIAFMGLNHFLQTEQMVGYAGHKGVPLPKLSVLASGGVLILGGLTIIAGVYPVLGALAIAVFLVASALLIHDFWSVPEDQKQDEMTQFLKNIALAGGALAIAVLGFEAWAFSPNLGLV